jgi:hypothetical protein
VQDVGQQSEDRQGERRVLVVGGADDPGLRRAGADVQGLSGGQRLLGGDVVERFASGVGPAGQVVSQAGRQQYHVAGHETGAGPAGHLQPGGSVGDGVKRGSGDAVQGQAPRFGRVHGRCDRAVHRGGSQDIGQDIRRHEDIVTSARAS